MHLREIEDESVLKDKALEIYNNFVKEDAPYQVNFDYFHVSNIKNGLETISKGASLFDEAMEHVRVLVESDVLPRFFTWAREEQAKKDIKDDDETKQTESIVNLEGESDSDDMDFGEDLFTLGEETIAHHEEGLKDNLPKFARAIKSLFYHSPISTILWISAFITQYANVLLTARLGIQEFCGAILGMCICNITFLFGTGILKVMYKICKEANAYSNTRKSSLGFSRAAAMLLIICCPSILFWCFVKFIFKGIDAQIASFAGSYCLWMIIGLPFYFASEILRYYLKSQKFKTIETDIISVGIALFNAYLLIFPLKLGLKGAPLSFALTYLISIIISLIISKIRRYDLVILDVSKQELLNLNEIIIALKSSFKEGLFVTINGIGELDIPVFIAAHLGANLLAGYFILIIGYHIIKTVPLFISKSIKRVAKTRVEQMGIEEAVLISKLSVVIDIVLSSVIILLLALLRKHWPYVFISNLAIIDNIGYATPMMLLFYFVEGINMVLRGYLPRVMPIEGIYMLRHYPLTIPLIVALSFDFSANLKISGLWLASFSSSVVLLLALLVVLVRTNWGRYLFEARIGAEYEKKALIELDEMYW